MSLRFTRGFVCGLIAAGLLIAAAGKANAYTRARHVVYTVFPASTERNALRVVGCETGHTFSPWSYNRSSGATGLFQVLQGNSGRRVFWQGHGSILIRGWLLWNPFYNARVALFLSRGGWDWHEWSCQP